MSDLKKQRAAECAKDLWGLILLPPFLPRRPSSSALSHFFPIPHLSAFFWAPSTLLSALCQLDFFFSVFRIFFGLLSVGFSLTSPPIFRATSHKSRDREIVRAQKDISKGRPKALPESCRVVTGPQV